MQTQVDIVAVLREYKKPIAGTVRKYTFGMNAEDREDIIQDVALKVFEKIHLFDATKGTMYQWVNHIARNAAIDALRRLKAKGIQVDTQDGQMHDGSSEDDHPMALQIPDPTQDPEATLMRRQLLAQLARLPDMWREFAYECFQPDFDPDAYAQANDVAVNTVYSRRNKVRAMIVALLENA